MLYDTTRYSEYPLLNDFRTKLLKSTEEIEVMDFGQGSRVFTSNKRKVAAIARHAGITSKRQGLLFRLTQYLKPEKALELGTSLGLATSAIALGNPLAAVTTIEGCPNTAKVAQKHFDALRLKQIKLYTKTFDTYFVENPSTQYDLIFVDGNHNKQSTWQYFELLLDNITPDSVIIFDDIYWSPPMAQTWEKIIRHPKVRVSIDTFQWGIVFFRTEQQKEHFTIRL